MRYGGRPGNTNYPLTALKRKTTLDLHLLIAGGVITEANAGQLQCKYVVEAANGPTTPGGDAVLRKRGITVLPDIFTNGGGVTVSFFEWVQVGGT